MLKLHTLAKKFYSLRSNPLALGSFLMMFSSVLVNFLSYLFNVFIVRLLGPADYGVFASLVSLLTIFSVPSSALTTSIAKFTAQYKGERKPEKIGTLFLILLKILLIFGVITSFFFIIFSKYIASFLNLTDHFPVILIGSFFLVVLPQTASLGVLQGLQSFAFLSLNSVFSAIVKLVGGLGLVYLGLAVKGAILGFLLAITLPFFTSLIILRGYFGKAKSDLSWRSFWKYTPLAALAVLGLTSLITTDIILVKHYFGPFEAGIYSSLSLVGRVILFFSSPIPVVMFPLITERHIARKRYHQYLFYSIALVAVASLSISVFYLLFPEFSIRFFFGQKFLTAAPYLGFFSVFIVLYSVSNVLVSFFLSIHKTKVAFFLAAASMLQWLLITIFHRNFWEVIGSSIAVLTLLTISLLLYLLFDDDFRNRSRLQTGENDR